MSTKRLKTGRSRSVKIAMPERDGQHFLLAIPSLDMSYIDMNTYLTWTDIM
jgi:hypothetical protein